VKRLVKESYKKSEGWVIDNCSLLNYLLWFWHVEHFLMHPIKLKVEYDFIWKYRI
jgi:hypothetical protein